jgi:hypothetical protein
MHVDQSAGDEDQLRVVRIASLVFAVVIFAGTEWALATVGFVKLLLDGVGASNRGIREAPPG